MKYKSTIIITDTEDGCRIEATIEPRPDPRTAPESPAVAMAQLMMDVARQRQSVGTHPKKKVKPRGK